MGGNNRVKAKSTTSSVTVVGAIGLTNAELRATAVPVTTGGLTDAQLRATAVPVTTGGLTDAQLRATAIPVTTGGLTDTQLRATPVTQNLTQIKGIAVATGLGTTGSDVLRVCLPNDQVPIPIISYTSTQGVGGTTPFMLVSIATTNATIVKAAGGKLHTITAINTGNSIAYLKIYNKATAPTVGTDVPVLIYAIPYNSAGAGISITLPFGVNFATGISYAITGAPATADTTAIAANQVILSGTFS